MFGLLLVLEVLSKTALLVDAGGSHGAAQSRQNLLGLAAPLVSIGDGGGVGSLATGPAQVAGLPVHTAPARMVGPGGTLGEMGTSRGFPASGLPLV